MNNSLFRVFFDKEPPIIVKGEGVYLFSKDGKKFLDMTAGGTSYAILGWNYPKVNKAMKQQIDNFCHIDYKAYRDENVFKLSDLIVKKAKKIGLDKFYFSGNSGAEACEAAMKISYQYHYENGDKNKKWFISRTQSYHGMSSDALALGERPNLEFYRPMLSPYRTHITMHHPLYLKKENETLDEYAKRSAKELEDKILEIGHENIAGFVGETIMGGLVGDVPPAPNYWKYIQEVCNKYNVHLILDEVYCGTGSSGRYFCCEYDDVKPDFLYIGKTLGAGYGVLSGVLTTNKIYEVIKESGRLQHSTTFQAHSLSVVAALAVQEIVSDEKFLNEVYKKGEFVRNYLKENLKDLAIYRDVRGRGLRNSFEYNLGNMEKNHNFGQMIEKIMKEKYQILISGKWHRISLTPPLIITFKELEYVLEKLVFEIKNLAKEF
jgi:adenosylmethionine-8-amino-7-oxononanoate aminotransferase